jgi:hypothetical protein
VDERVDERTVVVAVAGRLHDDVALEPEVVAQREQLFLRGIAGRVLALGRIGEGIARPEYVAVRIHGPGRHRETRLRRVRVKGQIVGIHGHAAIDWFSRFGAVSQSTYFRPALASASRIP